MANRLRDDGHPQKNAIIFEAVAELGKLLGLNKSAALALALLFAADRPLSLDEISADSGVAKSSSSVILKSLEQMGLVEVVHQPHNRRKFFQVADNPAERFAMLIARRLDSLAEHQQEMCQLHQVNPAGQYEYRVEQVKGIYQGLLQVADFLRLHRADAWKAFDNLFTQDGVADVPPDSATTR